MEKVVLFGTGQIASVAYSYINHDSKYEVACFTVDRKEIKEYTLFERLVIPFDDIISVFPPSDYVKFSLAIQVALRIRRTFDVDLSLQTFLKVPTIAGLAEKLEEQMQGQTQKTGRNSEIIVSPENARRMLGL